MDGATAISKLKANASALKALSATSLCLYGSTVRDEARPDSDLDLFVEYDSAKYFSLFDFAGIKIALEDELGVDVHVTAPNSLHPRLRKRIEQEAMRVF
jgi:predicted nucleotidyltransferase